MARPPPAPSTGRKPQTGRPREQKRRSALGGRLNYLVWLNRSGQLGRLVDQELTLRRSVLTSRSPSHLGGSPVTGPVRLRPAADPVLRLDADAIANLDPASSSTFDPTRPAVSVTLEFLGSMQDLLQLGAIPVVRSGDLFVAWVNLANVPTLAEHDAVVRMEATVSVAPTGNQGAEVPGHDNMSSLVLPATGKGVRLAVIDLGFDFLHPGLLRQVDDAEQVRALWLHDMVLQAPSAGALGQRFSHLELQQALDWYRSPQDGPPGPRVVEEHLKRLAKTTATNPETRDRLQMHGTAVTGIAAGNGRESVGQNAANRGVASEADLILIAIGGHDEMRFADSSQVLAAFYAAFEDTSSPCVALMANSDNLGPHDGSLDGERFLDELLLLPGRAIVLSAGNLNHVHLGPTGPAWHAVANADPSGERTLPLVLKYGPGAPHPDAAEVWFRPSNPEEATCTISVTLANNTTLPAVTLSVSSEPKIVLARHDNPNQTEVVAQLHRDDEADAYCLRLVFHPERTKAIAESTWTIDVNSDGRVHGWLDRNNDRRGYWTGKSSAAGANSTTLGSPASATRPLTVGSVENEEGTPSSFSGCGPLRVPISSRKPDLVAVGANVAAPVGVPESRLNHRLSPVSDYTRAFPSATSYAAPQVAGACALLFERFGTAATWADIRQAILQATERKPEMGDPDPTGWDSACGYGLLNVNALLVPPKPATTDVWLPKAQADIGTEPYVAWTFWDSPALMLEDAAGNQLEPIAVATGAAQPEKLRVRITNRGASAAREVIVRSWWARLGAMHPLPTADVGVDVWQASGFSVDGHGGNSQHVAEISPGATVDLTFGWVLPRSEYGDVTPHVLLATAGAEGDPFDPNDTICAQNNACALCVAVSRGTIPAEFTIIGSDDTDGVVVWQDDPTGRLRLENLPITALPWRDAAMFRLADRSDRPLYGSAGARSDLANRLSKTLEQPAEIAGITDVAGATRLVLQNGNVTIEGGSRLTIPRLRIAHGIPLAVRVVPLAPAPGAIHLLHLSGGRRVGGGTIQYLPEGS